MSNTPSINNTDSHPLSSGEGRGEVNSPTDTTAINPETEGDPVPEVSLNPRFFTNPETQEYFLADGNGMFWIAYSSKHFKEAYLCKVLKVPEDKMYSMVTAAEIKIVFTRVADHLKLNLEYVLNAIK